MKHAFSLVAACAALLIVSSHRVGAQAVYGSIVGTVTDSSGGAVPNAKITITDIGRDVTTAAVANESGNFMQRYLIVGRYRVRVEAPGFKAFVQDNVNVSVDTEVRLEARLEVGEVNQTVEVSAEVGILKTERSDVATTYSDRVIENLPILNRRFTNFQLMTPGVVSFPTSLTAASAENPQGSYRMLVNGQSFAGTSHLLDGTDNHDAVLGWIVINPTLDSVTEAKITTANYDAEFGVASAGVVSAQTKSGTNQMHGTAFEFLRNDHIQARNPFTQSRVIPNSGGRLVPLTWNFTLQHQLSSTSSVEAAYVGTKGTHVFAGTGGDYDPNQADINGFGITNTNQRKPFFQKFGWSQNLRYYGSDASNSYHSLQLKFDKRFANGFNVMSHYTWSKNIDYDSTYYPQDARLARGVSANNRAHVFFVASLYEVPFGQGRRYLNTMAKPLDFLIGGWQLNGTYSWMAGQPFTPGTSLCRDRHCSPGSRA